MIKKLTKRQNNILSYIKKFRSKYGRSPSFNEIRARFKFSSPNSVTCHIQALIKKEFLYSVPNMPYGIMPIDLLSQAEKNLLATYPKLKNIYHLLPPEVNLEKIICELYPPSPPPTELLSKMDVDGSISLSEITKVIAKKIGVDESEIKGFKLESYNPKISRGIITGVYLKEKKKQSRKIKTKKLKNKPITVPRFMRRKTPSFKKKKNNRLSNDKGDESESHFLNKGVVLI